MIGKLYGFYILVVINIILLFIILYLLCYPPQQVIIVQITEIVVITQKTTIPTIFDPPVEAPIPTLIPTIEPMVETLKSPRYGFTNDDIYLLAQLLCGQDKISGDGEYDFVCRGKLVEPYFPEMSKVLCVVMNRQRSGCFPNTVKGIITQKGQFSVIPNNLHATPSVQAIETIQQWCDAYDNYDSSIQTIPEDHLYFYAGKNNTNVTRENYK